MQTKKQFIIQTIKHAVVGVTFGYWFYNFCGFREFTADGVVLGIFICALIALFIGFLIEWCQARFFNADFDRMDIAVTSIGGAIGATLSLIVFNETALWILSIIGSVTAVHELYLYWKILRKR